MKGLFKLLFKLLVNIFIQYVANVQLQPQPVLFSIPVQADDVDKNEYSPVEIGFFQVRVNVSPKISQLKGQAY